MSSYKTLKLSIRYTIIPHSNLRQIERISSTLFHEKNSQRRYQYLVLYEGTTFILQKATLILTKSFV